MYEFVRLVAGRSEPLEKREKSSVVQLQRGVNKRDDWPVQVSTTNHLVAGNLACT